MKISLALKRLLIPLIAASVIAGCGRSKVPNADNLVAAARRDDVTAVQELLAKGANIDGQETGMLRETPLITCASTDGTNVFFFLLSRGANVNAPGTDGITPLMEAITVGDPNLFKVKALIKHGADVNAKDSNGVSVLRRARAANCKVVIEELIAAGAKE